MMRVWRVVLGCCLLCLGVLAQAQDIASPTLTTPRVQIPIYAGPGTSYAQTGSLLPGQLVNIVERNRMGDWVRIWQLVNGETLMIDGWVQTDALQLRTDLDLFGDVAENQWMLDGDPSRILDPQEAILYGFPIMPIISDAMQPVFERGIANGNNPVSVSRVGDSLLMSEWYLIPMENTDYQLGRYGYLESDLQLFGPHMHMSISAQQGLSTYTVFDSAWADGGCTANESPLQCEYRVNKPIAVFVMFGPNDVKIGSPDDYRTNLTRIIEMSLESGVIPVLMTFSSHPSHPLYSRTLAYNVIITELATQYQVPLINVWLATRTLPNYGLEQDLIHLKNSGFVFLNFDDSVIESSGVALLNLLSLRWMHELRVTFNLGDMTTVSP